MGPGDPVAGHVRVRVGLAQPVRLHVVVAVRLDDSHQRHVERGLVLPHLLQADPAGLEDRACGREAEPHRGADHVDLAAVGGHRAVLEHDLVDTEPTHAPQANDIAYAPQEIGQDVGLGGGLDLQRMPVDVGGHLVQRLVLGTLEHPGVTGRIQQIASGAIPLSSSHWQVSMPVLSEPMTV